MLQPGGGGLETGENRNIPVVVGNKTPQAKREETPRRLTSLDGLHSLLMGEKRAAVVQVAPLFAQRCPVKSRRDACHGGKIQKLLQQKRRRSSAASRLRLIEGFQKAALAFHQSRRSCPRLFAMISVGSLLLFIASSRDPAGADSRRQRRSGALSANGQRRSLPRRLGVSQWARSPVRDVTR